MVLANFEKLEKNIDFLSGISREGGFDITPYLLSEDDAVKKLIAQKNPLMSKEDIDLLVDSAEQSLKKDDELEEELSAEDNVDVEDIEEEEGEDAPNLSEDEKELRRIQREERREQRRNQREEKKKERQKDREIRREKRRELIIKIKENFKNQLKEIRKEVKKIIKKVVQAASDLWRKYKELVRELGLAVVEFTTSITAISIIFSTPPWNVPQAITLVIEVVLSYLNIISKIQDIAPVLFPLKDLPLVTDRKNLLIVSAILNPILELVKKLWIPISALKKSIEKLIEELKKLMGSDSKDRIFRKATKRLKKLGHIRKGPEIPTPSISVAGSNIGLPLPDFIKRILRGRGDEFDSGNIRAYDEEDVDEIRSLLDQFVLNGDGSSKDHKVVDFQKKFDQQLTDLEKELEEVEIPVQVSDEDIDSFIYDVTLPDGTVIKNISEEGIEYFKKTYTLKFTNFTLP